MKKFLIALVFVVFSCVLTACSKSPDDLINKAMSEVTYRYFSYENDDFSLSISVGKRENPYFVDGVHHDTVDFSLIVFKDKQFKLTENSLVCQLIIAGQNNEITLEYNPIADAYMYDLGYEIKNNDKVDFFYNGKIYETTLLSESFGISTTKAIEIASKEFNDLIKKYTSNNKLQGECYLKVLGERGNRNSDQLFWCFTFVANDNTSYNLIVSVEDGIILASDIN